jgi:polyisoprenoid-binding protein YceI
MTKHCVRATRAVALVTLLAPLPLAAQSPAPPTLVEVQGGTASFEANTNVSAINVRGKSTALTGRAEVRRAGDALAIDNLEATVPVGTLATGLGLRDQHMRKYVFTTPDGQVPDLKLAAGKAQCAAGGGAESACQLTGQMSIRGVARPFTMTLKVARAGEAYRASGDTTVKLSTYGIERPSELGVTTADEVKLHVEFTAKPAPAQMTRNGGAK